MAKRDLDEFQQCTFVWNKEWWNIVKAKATSEGKTASAFVHDIVDAYRDGVVLKENNVITEDIAKRMELLEDKMNLIIKLLSK